MKRESFICLIDLYLTVQNGIKGTLELLLGSCVSTIGYEEGFLGKLTKIESVIKNECHPSFMECDEDGCSFYSIVLDDTNLSSEEKADILMNPRKAY